MSRFFDSLRLGFGKPDDNERIYNTALTDAERYLREQPDPRDAEIARLKAAVETLKLNRDSYADAMMTYSKRAEAAEAENRRLREALERIRDYAEAKSGWWSSNVARAWQ